MHKLVSVLPVLLEVGFQLGNSCIQGLWALSRPLPDYFTKQANHFIPPAVHQSEDLVLSKALNPVDLYSKALSAADEESKFQGDLGLA